MTLKGNISSVLNMPVVFGIPYSERCYPANSPDNRWPIFVKLVQSGHHLRQSHLSTLVIQKDLNLYWSKLLRWQYTNLVYFNLQKYMMVDLWKISKYKFL